MAHLSISKASISKASIAEQDKKLMDLQEHIENKQKQLKEDYQRMQKDLKHNPHLQVALEEYKSFFAKEKREKEKKIKALSALIQHIESLNGDKNDIIELKREIQLIKK